MRIKDEIMLDAVPPGSTYAERFEKSVATNLFLVLELLADIRGLLQKTNETK